MSGSHQRLILERCGLEHMGMRQPCYAWAGCLVARRSAFSCPSPPLGLQPIPSLVSWPLVARRRAGLGASRAYFSTKSRGSCGFPALGLVLFEVLPGSV